MQASVTSQDLPALYRAADRSAIGSQKKYFRFVRTDLSLVVVAAVVTSWAVTAPTLRTGLAAVGAISLVGGLSVTALLLQAKPDRRWFGARAVAESVKTIAWRYMMAAEPYQKPQTEAEADAVFAREIQAILREKSALGPVLGGPEAAAEQITEVMRKVRATPVEERRSIYLRDRIGEQRTWYARRAQANARSSTRWLVAVGSSQLAGAASALVLVLRPELELNAAAIFAAAAAAFMAWLQVKQHQELASSYALAAQELGLVEIGARHATSEERFAAFVADAESAISREHTMWVARRDVVS